MQLSLTKTRYSVFFIALLLQACSSSSRYSVHQDYGPTSPVDVSQVKNAVPKVEPRSKYGNPSSYKVRGKVYHVLQNAQGYSQKGIASWYGKKFHGHRTSSGEIYNMYAMTAAHKTLPLPSYVRVTSLKDGKSVIVKVNDRGPFHENRIIDLSYAAAKKLGVTARGTGAVEVTVIDPENFQRTANYQPAVKRPSALGTYKGTYTAAADFKLYLQVGAFSSKENAYQLRKRLSGMFKPSRVHSEFSSAQNIYRVRIGPLSGVNEADKLTTLLNNKGISTAKIIID